MNRIHKQRIYLLVIVFFTLALAAAMILYALTQNINVFMTPSQLSSNSKMTNYRLRLGGVVKENSVKRDNDLKIEFVVTDFKHDVPVQFKGILPDLFREGKGVIAEGKFKDGMFFASNVLAKHDENYMPKSVYERMRNNNGA